MQFWKRRNQSWGTLVRIRFWFSLLDKVLLLAFIVSVPSHWTLVCPKPSQSSKCVSSCSRVASPQHHSHSPLARSVWWALWDMDFTIWDGQNAPSEPFRCCCNGMTAEWPFYCSSSIPTQMNLLQLTFSWKAGWQYADYQIWRTTWVCEHILAVSSFFAIVKVSQMVGRVTERWGLLAAK